MIVHYASRYEDVPENRDGKTHPSPASDFVTKRPPRTLQRLRRCVGVGQDGLILSATDLTATNGSNWTKQTSNTSQLLKSIAWSGSQFVTVGEGGTILTSSDALQWTPQSAGTSQTLNSITWSGTQFVTVGETQSGSAQIFTSPDGKTWTAQSAGTAVQLRAVACSDMQCVAVGDLDIVTSADGKRWTVQDIDPPTVLPHTVLAGVTWTGKQFVAVGYFGVVYTSSDGNTWTSQKSGISQTLQGIAWSGTQLVVVGQKGTILTSP